MPGMPSLARSIFQRREIVENWVKSLKGIFSEPLFRFGEAVGCESSSVEFVWEWLLHLGSLAHCCFSPEASFKQIQRQKNAKILSTLIRLTLIIKKQLYFPARVLKGIYNGFPSAQIIINWQHVFIH